jgi:hypothetical protein
VQDKHNSDRSESVCGGEKKNRHIPKKSVRWGDGAKGIRLWPPTPAAAGGEDGDAAMVADACDSR